MQFIPPTFLKHLIPIVFTHLLLLTCYYPGKLPTDILGINAKILYPEGNDKSEKNYFIGDTIKIRLTVHGIKSVNAINFGILYTDTTELTDKNYLEVDSLEIPEEDFADTIETFIICNKIGKACFVAVAHGDVNSRYDTIDFDITVNAPPSCSNSLRVTKKDPEMVSLTWERDILTDTYTVLCSSKADSDDWDSIATTKDTTFIDITDSDKFYRLRTTNDSGSCESGDIVFGADTLHFAHVISFTDSISTVSENDSTHKIKVQVSEMAKNDIIVWVKVKKDHISDDDFSLESSEVSIEKDKKNADVVLHITDDNNDESPETLTISIDSVSSGYPMGVLQHTVVITDNDTFYTVTYMAVDVDEGDVPVDSDRYKAGDSVKVTGNTGNLEKEGFVFVGWNTKKDGSDTTYMDGEEFIMGSDSVILYAKWETAYYTVTFDTQEGSAVDSQLIAHGKTITKPSDPQKEKSRFGGWYTEPSCTNEWEFTSGKVTENVTLYAKWTPVFTVTYRGNDNTGGEAPVDENLYENGQTVMALSNKNGFTRTGYTFSAWNTERDGSGTTYNSGSNFNMGSDDVTLFAQWNANPYKLFFKKNDDDAIGVMNALIIACDSTITLPKDEFTKTGWQFTGWAKSSDGVVVYADLANYKMGTENDTLYAQWKITKYSIIYHLNSGTNGTNPDSFTIETATINFIGATKKSYTFDGWYDNENCTGNTVDSIPRGSTSKRELWARWIITDVDGNIYTEVKIGNQVWMVENLKTTRYNNGDSIPQIADAVEWADLSTPGYCWYYNDTTYKEPYGALYNWYAVNTGELAPEGWHVPSDPEWDTLQNYLIVNEFNYDRTTSGNKIAKSMAAINEWPSSTGEGAIGNDPSKNNRSGFSAFPGGCRHFDGIFDDIQYRAQWWSSSDNGLEYAWKRYIDFFNVNLQRDNVPTRDGLSIRCIKD